MSSTLPSLGLHGLGGLWSTIAARLVVDWHGACLSSSASGGAHMKMTWRVERLKDLAALSVGLSILLLIARLW
jgi:hypothetical protein